MPRRVFYSFEYKPDNARAAQVRNIGMLESNRPATDNSWEEVKRGGDPAIARWIDGQMVGKSCTVVLIGSTTANRKWINYEIIRSWNEKMGLVGIHIHGLKNLDGATAAKGANPFGFIKHGASGKMLSEIVRCYDPGGSTSKECYEWIGRYLGEAVEEAIKIRNGYQE